MANINGVDMTDEQFMLSMELGKILQDEGYVPKNDEELNPDVVKSERGKKIVERLLEIVKEKNNGKQV